VFLDLILRNNCAGPERVRIVLDSPISACQILPVGVTQHVRVAGVYRGLVTC
jgi:hypothetical protein